MDKIIIKSVKALDRRGWAPQFTIGVQTFFLNTKDTKQEADWFCEQLKTAFENLLKKGDREFLNIPTANNSAINKPFKNKDAQ